MLKQEKTNESASLLSQYPLFTHKGYIYRQHQIRKMPTPTIGRIAIKMLQSIETAILVRKTKLASFAQTIPHLRQYR